MKTVTPVDLQQILAAQPSVPVIDVRTPVEFAEVHVPQARSIPLDELKPSALPLAKDQPVYLLCRSGQRATKAAEKFAKEGFTQPIVVAGGTLAWMEANLPVTRG
jgi:rhodanese-related sulfurtransferase